MRIKSVNAKFMLLLLPLLALCFVLSSGVTYYMASDFLSRGNVLLARCIGNEAALRMQISVADIHLPLKVAAAHPDALLSEDEAVVLGELNALKKTSPLIGQILFARPDGQTLRADGVRLDRGSREYFQRVVRTGLPYITKPFLGETTRKMQAMVLQPVFSDGELRGVLFASVHLHTLVEKVLEKEIFSDESIYIIAEDGLVVGCREQSGIADSPGVVGENVTDDRLEEAIRTAVAAEEQTFTKFRASDGTERFAAVTPFDLSGNRWAIVSSFPQERVNARIRQLLEAVAAVFFVTILLAFVIVRFFAHTISEPLHKIASEFQSIGDEPALESGADEIGALARGVEKMRSIQDENKKMEQQALSDELTGRFNRFGVKRKAGEAMAEHEGQAAMIVLADLDHLKHINDEIGHAAGDDALCAAARLLMEGFGEDAVISRSGGDEFVILAFGNHGDSAKAIDGVRRLLREYNERSRKPYLVELSMGAAEFVCSPDADILGLMREADESLYKAKTLRRETAIR